MQKQTHIIKPTKGIIGIHLNELWEFRGLLYFLTLRDIKVRYKQTFFGGAWAILQPFLTMVIFTIFFGKIAKISSDGIPYPIFSYAGLLLWTYFSNALSHASTSIIADERLITKVYFPRLILPTSATFVGLIDYIIASSILFGFMIYYQFTPSLAILLLPFILFFTWMLAAGISYFVSAVNVKYRDVRYIIPFFLQILIYITPVIYPFSLAPSRFRWILAINPMAGFIEAHRAIILGYQPINTAILFYSIGITIIIFITGLIYFKSVERFFADII